MMKIQDFFLDDFSCDINSMKNGGEACVLKGLHSHHGEVAIKLWDDHRDVMNKEIELLMQNAYHQNIIQFLGILIDEESKCIGYVMPYMPNGSLENVIHNQAEKYDEKQILSWVTQICRGLSHLHFKKIIHRDIKPSNVLLGKSRDDIKLSDLDWLGQLGNIVSTLTKGLGTIAYMAPEIFKGESYDFSADIHSLSITIWEILHRKTPYDHVTNMFQLVNKIPDGERPKLNNDLSKDVSDLLKRCWHADASKRPTIDYVREFFSKTTSLYTNLENSVNECTTSFEHLTVHKNINHSLAQVPLNRSNKKSPISNPIEKKPEKQTILLLGREDEMNGDSLMMLDDDGQSWKKLSVDLPYAIQGHGAQFLNNALYIFGGQKEKTEMLNSAYKLLTSLQWEKVADMNKKRSGISNSTVILNNQIWVCGGQNGPYLNEVLKSVEMYDPLTNKWKYMKQLSQSRSVAAAAVVNGKIFCSGGLNGGDYLDSVECYDPSSDVWTPICNMPQEIWGHGAVEMDGNFIVMGCSTVLAWDATDRSAKWIKKSSLPLPCSHFSIAKIDEKTFICGGKTQSHNWYESLDAVEIFDGEVWINGPKMPTYQDSAAAVVIPKEFAKKLVKDNIVASEDLNVYSNSSGSLAPIPLNRPNENFSISNPIEQSSEEQTILLLGGENGTERLRSSVILESKGLNWKQLSIELPYNVDGHGAGYLNNNLYIFGGRKAKYEPENSTYKLSRSLQWEKMADMDEKRYGISNSTVILNNLIWVCGGCNEDEKLNSVEMYDPSTNKWKYMKKMNQRRQSPAVAVVNGKIFCAGGWNNSAEYYDPYSDVWTPILKIQHMIFGHGAVEMNGNFIVMGGCNEREFLNNVWEWNPTNRNAVWISKPSMSLPRRNFSVAKIDGKIFICGGRFSVDDQCETLDLVEFFDGEVWRDGPTMPAIR